MGLNRSIDEHARGGRGMPAGMVYCTFSTRSSTMVNRWRLSASSGRSKGYSQNSMTCDLSMGLDRHAAIACHCCRTDLRAREAYEEHDSGRPDIRHLPVIVSAI